MINNLKRSLTKNLDTIKEPKELNKSDKEINSNIVSIKSSKDDTKLTLVEEIEEFGFIPSIDKENNTNAA
ncbi:hypothetical protein EW15_1686 [Prochlorococcus sp. MIT 0801]|nr:hypothetical protein EW15_1686 [Prochlorococcus sp. MIT 0801]